MNTKDLELIKGTSHNYTLNFTKAGASVDITGWEIDFDLKRVRGATTSILSKKVLIHTDAENGQSKFPMVPTDTSGMTKGKYFYLIKVITDKGEVFPLLSGAYRILEV
jgi:hypothetical protein